MNGTFADKLGSYGVNGRLALLLVAVGCGLLANPIFANTNEPVTAGGFVFRTWGTEAGLPQNTVSVIRQTRDGYLWLGTQGGLARFDGVRFKTYGQAQGLPSVPVRALCEDHEGRLWIGTYGGGLSCWRNGRMETFAEAQGLRDVNVTALAEDATGRMWVGTATGLSLFQDGKAVRDEALSGLGTGLIRAVLRGRRDVMWISSSHGLFEFVGGRLTECIGPLGDEKISAYCLLEDRDGNLWASIGDGKVLCRRNGVWGKYGEASGLPWAFVTSLEEGADGTIWAGSLDAGLYYLKEGCFQAITKQDGLSGDAIRSLLSDREGNLWVGTRSCGLTRLARRKVSVYGPAQGLEHDFTRAVAETADGSLWVGTTGGGLYRGDLETFSRFGDTRIRFYTSVESVLATRDGSLWWGCFGALLQWKDDKLAAFYARDGQPWLGYVPVTALCEDSQGGLWLGTGKGGLLHYRDGVFTPFDGRVASGMVTALALEPDGTLWIGSSAGGLSRVRGNNFENFSSASGFPSSHIRTLCLDKDSTLWIGTSGAGLIRLRKGRIDSFTARQGLGDDTVSQILEDDAGHLWLGCNRGIFRCGKAELESLADDKTAFIHTRAYGVTDGMLTEECAGGSSPAGIKLRSGQLCFPTPRGLVVIDPRQQEMDAQPPPVMVEEVRVDRQTQEIRPQTDRHADTSPVALVIAPGAREIDFHYTALNFSAPENIHFRFKLDGLDSDWVEAGTRRVAYYQRIHPGNYVFRVLACNADGIWSAAGAALAVTVQPFFWQTDWFLVVVGLVSVVLLAGTINGLVRRRYQRRLAQVETRNAIERERLRISQDMHDDIGGILTRVSMLSDAGQSLPAVTASQQFERIGSQVRAAVVALDEIVWATNPKDDNLSRFAEYVGRFADECFEGAPVRCWQDIPTDLPFLPLRADVRHNVFLAVKEALNNVLKHSGATEVWLRLTLVEGRVSLEIQDNGRGFARESMPSGGNGLHNMRSRLAECGGTVELASSHGKGVTIRFAFPMPLNPEP